MKKSMEPWYTPLSHQESKGKAALYHWGVQGLTHLKDLKNTEWRLPQHPHLTRLCIQCKCWVGGGVVNAVLHVVLFQSK